MHLHPEALADPPGQFGRLELRFCGQGLLQILSDVGSELVRAFGAAFVREEAFQTRGLESLPCLIDGGPGETKLDGGLGEGLSVGLDGPEGLVFELEQVVRIEELGVGEAGVAHFFGTWVEGSAGAEGVEFGGIWGHKCKYIYAVFRPDKRWRQVTYFVI
jgi:hypothetical protein